MTSDAVRLGAAVCACVAGWVAHVLILRQAERTMVKQFLDSKFGRSVVAAFCGGLAPAVPALVMGDVHTFRIALSAALGATATVVALHFKSEGGAA